MAMSIGKPGSEPEVMVEMNTTPLIVDKTASTQ